MSYEHVCALYACLVPSNMVPEEGFIAPGNRVTDGCEGPYPHWLALIVLEGTMHATGEK